MNVHSLPLSWQVLCYVLAQMNRWFPTIGMLFKPEYEAEVAIKTAKQALKYEAEKGKPATWEELCRKNKDLRNVLDQSKGYLFPFDFTGLPVVNGELAESVWQEIMEMATDYDRIVKALDTRPLSQGDPVWQLIATVGRRHSGMVLGSGLGFWR